MFPNCTDGFGRKKRETKVQQANKEKPREKNEKWELKYLPWTTIRGINRKEILNYSPDKFLIPVYKIYLHATLPPTGLYRV